MSLWGSMIQIMGCKMSRSLVARLVIAWTLIVFAGNVLAGAAEPAGKAFYLLTTKNPETIRFRLPIFERELYRQALLIAAREDLGLQTRDESLREWQAAPEGAWDLKQHPLKI